MKVVSSLQWQKGKQLLFLALGTTKSFLKENYIVNNHILAYLILAVCYN